MHKFTAIVPQMACALKFYKCACVTPHLHRISNLTKKIVSTGQFTFDYKVLKKYIIRKVVKQGIIWFSNMQIRYFKNLCEPCLNALEEDNYEYFHPNEDPDDYRSDMDDDHDLMADIDSDTLIKIVKFLKRGKAPGPDNIHNEVLRLGTTTSLFHHLARFFTSSI